MGGYYYSNEIMSSAAVYDTQEDAQAYGAELLTSGLFEFFQIKKMTLNKRTDFEVLFKNDSGAVIPPTRECFCSKSKSA